MQQLRQRLSKFQRRAPCARASTPGGCMAEKQHAALSRKWVAAAMDILSTWEPTRDSVVECCRHKKLCPAFPPRSRRFHLEVSGVNCQPWSQAGKRRGWLDDRSIPCLALIRLILMAEPDGVCIECTPAFDFDTLLELLRPKYGGDYAITSPEDLGLPVSRRRMYMWFERRATISAAHARIGDFLKTSRRVPSLGPDVFLRASAEEVQAYYREVLGQEKARSAPVLRRQVRSAPVLRRQTAPAETEAAATTLQDVLHVGYRKRYLGHRKLVDELPAAAKSKAHIADVNVTPEYARGPKTCRVATILRSSCLVVMSESGREFDRLLLPAELPAIHGLQLPPLPHLPMRAVRSLVGNSMHVAQVGCFLQYALATRSLREQ